MKGNSKIWSRNGAKYPANPGVFKEIEHKIPQLKRYAQALTRNRDQAEDLVQDCLEKAVSHTHQFTPGTDMKCWLFAILRNTHIDGQRKIKRRGVHVEFEDWLHEAHQPPAQYAHVRLGEVGRAMARLRPCDRRVIRLVVFEGMKYHDAAHKLDIAVGTVKSRLSRARRALSAMS